MYSERSGTIPDGGFSTRLKENFYSLLLASHGFSDTYIDRLVESTRHVQEANVGRLVASAWVLAFAAIPACQQIRLTPCLLIRDFVLLTVTSGFDIKGSEPFYIRL